MIFLSDGSRSGRCRFTVGRGRFLFDSRIGVIVMWCKGKAPAQRVKEKSSESVLWRSGARCGAEVEATLYRILESDMKFANG